MFRFQSETSVFKAILNQEMIADHILDKVSYEKMLFSLKPLKLKSWYNNVEIELITKYQDYERNKKHN